MFLGIVIFIAGATLVLSPLDAARFAKALRFVTYRDDAASLGAYRRAGVAIAVAGILLTFALR